MSDRSTARAERNRRVRRYFERTVKPTMVPRDSRYLRRHVTEALRFGGIAPADRVLEIGCGMGRYTLILAELGYRVEGLDLSSVLLDRMRAYHAGRVDIPLHCADISDPPVELRSGFDAVLGFFVLHHIMHLDEALAGISQVLKPGGRVVCLEPNPMNPLYYLQILFSPGMTWDGERGILRMRRRHIFEAMERAGLQQPRLSTFGLLPPFLVDRDLGISLESRLERVRAWQGALLFQLFAAERS